MKKAFFASIAVLFIVGFFTLPVLADDSDTLARFKGGIGVIPRLERRGSSGIAADLPTVVNSEHCTGGVQPAPGQIHG